MVVKPKLVLVSLDAGSAPQLGLLMGRRTTKVGADYYSILLANGHLAVTNHCDVRDVDLVSMVGSLETHGARPVFPLFGYRHWDHNREVCRVRYCPVWDFSYLCDLAYTRLPLVLAKPQYATKRDSASNAWVKRIGRYYFSPDFRVVPIVVDHRHVALFRKEVERLRTA